MRRFWAGFGIALDELFTLPEEIAHFRCDACGLHWFDPLLPGPPLLYEKLTAWAPYYRTAAWEWPVALDVLRRHGTRRLLEIGCGTGEFLSRVRDIVPTAEGLEWNSKAAATARSRQLTVHEGTLESLPGGWDAIAAFQVLEHLPDPAAFFRTCDQLLAPGGLLVVALPNQDGFMGGLRADWLNRPPHHLTLWPRSSLLAAARRFGLDLTVYRTEPLRRDEYRLWLLRRRRPATSFAGKLRNVAARLWARLMSFVAFPLARHRLAGATQLAAFRKAG
jgi:SAM-dependent methyltransferase